jgi:nicotinamidase-related amidase
MKVCVLWFRIPGDLNWFRTNPTGAKLDAQALMHGNIQALTENEVVCYKSRFNGFHDTFLNQFLESKNVDSVVILGITFPNCVRATQLGAIDHDHRVGLVPSGCTQVFPEGLKTMQGEGVQLMSLDDLRRFLTLDSISQ